MIQLGVLARITARARGRRAVTPSPYLDWLVCQNGDPLMTQDNIHIAVNVGAKYLHTQASETIVTQQDEPIII